METNCFKRSLSSCIVIEIIDDGRGICKCILRLVNLSSKLTIKIK